MGTWQISVTWVRKDCQRGIQHYGAAFKHSWGDAKLSFPLSLPEDVRNSKLLYLHTLGLLVLIFISKVLFSHRSTFIYCLKIAIVLYHLTPHREFTLRCYFCLFYSLADLTNWEMSQAPYSSGHQNHEASMCLGLVWGWLLFFSFLVILPFMLIPALNTASWPARQLGKTRSTVSATYMCSHIVTICLVVPEVSSSYHKKHCHIKHPADTETTEWGTEPCWLLSHQVMASKCTSTEPLNDSPSRSFPPLPSPS